MEHAFIERTTRNFPNVKPVYVYHFAYCAIRLAANEVWDMKPSSVHVLVKQTIVIVLFGTKKRAKGGMIKKGTAVDLLNLFLFSSVYFTLSCNLSSGRVFWGFTILTICSLQKVFFFAVVNLLNAYLTLII